MAMRASQCLFSLIKLLLIDENGGGIVELSHSNELIDWKFIWKIFDDITMVSI